MSTNKLNTAVESKIIYSDIRIGNSVKDDPIKIAPSVFRKQIKNGFDYTSNFQKIDIGSMDFSRTEFSEGMYRALNNKLKQ